MDGSLDVVRGRRIDRIEGAFITHWMGGFERAIVDLGTGDGRWVYRQARRHPRWAFVGIDANARLMREVSFRAGRKAARGGIGNLLFIRAEVHDLPQALNGVADEIYVLYPWGRLLETVWTPRPEGLRAVVRLARPAGRLEVHVNASAVANRWTDTATLVAGYDAAGIRLQSVRLEADAWRTSWAGRIAHGRDPRVVVLKGTAVLDQVGPVMV